MVEKTRKAKLLGRMKPDRSRLCLGLLSLQLAACSGGEENTLIPDSSIILLDEVRISQTIHKIEVPANHFAFLRVDAPGSEIRASFRDENQPAVTSVKPLYLRSAPLFLCIDTDTIELKNELKIDSTSVRLN